MELNFLQTWQVKMTFGFQGLMNKSRVFGKYLTKSELNATLLNTLICNVRTVEFFSKFSNDELTSRTKFFEKVSDQSRSSKSTCKYFRRDLTRAVKIFEKSRALAGPSFQENIISSSKGFSLINGTKTVMSMVGWYIQLIRNAVQNLYRKIDSRFPTFGYNVIWTFFSLKNIHKIFNLQFFDFL